MLSLPYPPRRSHLRGFWLVLTLTLAPLYMVALWLFGPGLAMTASGLVLFGAVVLGFAWAPLPKVLYRIWMLAAQRFAVVGRLYVAALIHFLLLPSAGRAEAALALSDPKGSMWRPYRAAPEGAGGSVAAEEKWFMQLVRESRTRGRGWWLLLLPPLMVLSLFVADAKDDKSVPENIYTLF
jgi:hypothetical protein